MIFANRDEAPIEGRTLISQWAELLRTACVALVDASPSVIAAINVRIALDSSLERTHLVEHLAAHFAEEYGLQVQIEMNHRAAMVRFSRGRS